MDHDAMRPVVSYDDITLPYHPPDPQSQPRSYPPKYPLSKKRKFNKANGKMQRASHQYSNPMNNGINHAKDFSIPSSNPTDGEYEKAAEGEISRELTHDEIWDDSALIDAWNAATEEYEAYNGPDKGWKAEPTHKSPLWYNVPPASSKAAHNATPEKEVVLASLVKDENTDSQPLNFDTFVPSHDPSLDLPQPTHKSDYTSYGMSEPPGPMVSQDEAFTRALGAMYWSGYWTAMYHCQRNTTLKQEPKVIAELGENESENENEENEFVSTQR